MRMAQDMYWQQLGGSGCCIMVGTLCSILETGACSLLDYQISFSRMAAKIDCSSSSLIFLRNFFRISSILCFPSSYSDFSFSINKIIWASPAGKIIYKHFGTKNSKIYIYRQGTNYNNNPDFIFINMRKNQHKNKPQPKTKIQLKIRSKNVTNNFILTPRTASAMDQRDNLHKLDKFAQEMKSQKERKDDMASQRTPRDNKKPEYRMVSTDHPKLTTAKKRNDEDQTGTHTPLLKRVSLNSDIGIKKKSTQSLMNSQRVKGKKKSSSKLSNSASGQINKTTLQRLIGVIIKDYKEGKLKERQLQQTLMELYDRKQKKKSLGKNKKRKDLFNTFSNEFIKSSHQIRSEALVRKRKKSDEIHESVLQRKGFVNKIIIKGITTSLFLREDAQLTNIKQSDPKTKLREQSYQINTQNSIKQIYDDMVNIKQHIFQAKQEQKMSLKEKMAIKIQRAWRRYKTRKLLQKTSKIKSSRRDSQPFHILDEFTDQQNDEPYYESTFTRNIVRPHDFEAESKQYTQLVNIISSSLQQKKLSKEECLKKILKFLHCPQQLIQTAQKEMEKEDLQQKQEEEAQPEHQPSMQGSGKASRVIIFDVLPQDQIAEKDQQKSQGGQSNELNSFTNKYSSKEVNNEQREHFAPSEQNTSELDDQSLTFVHSQTSANQSFKMINIQNIEEGLKGRQESLQLKKEKQLQGLTEKLFMKKLSKEQYQRQKEKIDKWFRSRQKQLKRIKNSLLKSCLDAKNLLQSQSKVLNTQKSKKMLKCLSDKYIKKQDWLIRQQKTKQKELQASEHLPCQQNEFQLLQVANTKQTYNHDAELADEEGDIIFNQNEAIQPDWEQVRGYEISPKMSRHTSLEENQYRYQEVEKIIQQDDDLIQAGLGGIENRQLQSDKFIDANRNNNEYISAEEISLINNYVNQTTKKFKYLCTEDKEDIFQFLFLDMVLEMFTEPYPGQTKVLRAAQAYINKAKRLRKIPKGIKTNLVSCKQYLRILHDFVLKEKNSLKGLLNPMGPSAAEMLRYMRDQIIQADDDDNGSSALVLSVDIFERLGKTKQLELKIERYYEDQERQAARVGFLKTALHINNKSLFDSLNEMLDHERPYGVWGKPFPWKKTLSIDKKWTRAEQERKLKVSIDKTIECCSYLCGILADKQDSLFGSHRVSQEYITQIREDRLSKMLANDLIQNEQRWIFYDDEQTQTLMEASAFITKKLIKEMVLQLVSLGMRR